MVVKGATGYNIADDYLKHISLSETSEFWWKLLHILYEFLIVNLHWFRGGIGVK